MTDESTLDHLLFARVDAWGRSEPVPPSPARSTPRCIATGSAPSGKDSSTYRSRAVRCSSATTRQAVLPSDAPVVMHGIETELLRPVYGLAENLFRQLPVLGTLWFRAGGVPAHPDNAYRLLHDDHQLVLVFPEGTKATGKLARDRYQLRRFGRTAASSSGEYARGGADRADGDRRATRGRCRSSGRAHGIAKLLGLPYFPITANQFVYGPLLGYVLPLPAKFRIRVLPPITFDVEPGLAHYDPRHGHGAGRAHPVAHPVGSRRPPAQPTQRLAGLSRVRILVTGLGTCSAASRVAQALEQRSDVALVVGVDTPAPRLPLTRTEFVQADASYTILRRVVRATQVDTVLHTHLEADSTRTNSRRIHEVNVIGTMNLLAAAAAEGSAVRKIVLKTSTLVYGSNFADPYFFRETDPSHASAHHTGRALVARGGPRSSVTSPRTTPRSRSRRCASPTCSATTSARCSRACCACPRSPRCSATTRVCSSCTRTTSTAGSRTRPPQTDRMGTFNMAGPGTITWSEACRAVARRRLAMPPVFTGKAAVAAAAAACGRHPARSAEPAALRAQRRRAPGSSTPGSSISTRRRRRSRRSPGPDGWSGWSARHPEYEYDRDVEDFLRNYAAVLRPET